MDFVNVKYINNNSFRFLQDKANTFMLDVNQFNTVYIRSKSQHRGDPTTP